MYKRKLKIKLWFLFFASFVLQTWSITQPIYASSPNKVCLAALISNSSSLKDRFYHVEDILLGFSNELLPRFRDSTQEALFRTYMQVYFGSKKRKPVQKYITSAINKARKYNHLLPYKKSFRRFQIKPPSSSSKTVRPLSFIEAPLRGCLGNDCSTNTYMEIAFHPNYYYFTLTDQAGISNGHITIVLGSARYRHVEKVVRVAFIDKVQNLSSEDLPLMIEAIRQSVLEHGYILALPDQLGDHIGISTSKVIRSFIKDHIPLLKQQALTDFYPHAYPSQIYPPKNIGFSRANIGLLLFPVKSLKGLLTNYVNRGMIIFPWSIQQHIEDSTLYDYLVALSQKSQQEPIFLANLLLHLPDKIKSLDVFQDLTFDVLKQVEKKDLYDLFLEAVINMDTYTTSLLVHEYGVNINTSIWFMSALHFALQAQHPKQKEMIAHLLDLGADVNAQDLKGASPLYNAIKNDLDMDIIMLLLDHKANINAKTFSGNTPLALARKKGDQTLITVLLEYKHK